MRSAFGNFASSLGLACGMLTACGGEESPSDDGPGAGTAGANVGGGAGTGTNTGGMAGELGVAGSGGVSGSAGFATGGTGGEGKAGKASWACAGNPTTLREAAACSGKLIGVALSEQRFSDAGYMTAAEEFNYVTAENEMKWNHTEPEQGRFTYDEGDRIVDFALEHDMALKGHTLVWYNQLPDWVEALTTAEAVRSAMVNHITEVMTHYKGKLIAWDVVNEAWADSGVDLRDNVFLRTLGPAYIDEAFQAARAADPDAKLYYNDYGADGLGAKSDSIYEMVRSMKERGIPIDGVGLQMHTRINGWPSAAEFSENVRRLGELGVEVVVSEIEVAACGAEPVADRLEMQRTRYHELMWACLELEACKAFTVWGIKDRYSWLNYFGPEISGCNAGDPPLPLPWGDDDMKKPAYYGLLDALAGRRPSD